MESLLCMYILPENKEKQAVNVNQLSKKMKVTPSITHSVQRGPSPPPPRRLAPLVLAPLYHSTA